MTRQACLFVISGPSGAGKGTLVSRVRASRPDLALTVSATTRLPRPGEKQGVHYWFFTVSEFESMIDEGGFVEWAQVHDNYYGTLSDEVTSKMAQGSSVILEIDPQGALQVKERFPHAILIFIDTPSDEVLKDRLQKRNTEDSRAQATRLANALEERKLVSRYDKIVINDDLKRATRELLDLIDYYECQNSTR